MRASSRLHADRSNFRLFRRALLLHGGLQSVTAMARRLAKFGQMMRSLRRYLLVSRAVLAPMPSLFGKHSIEQGQRQSHAPRSSRLMFTEQTRWVSQQLSGPTPITYHPVNYQAFMASSAFGRQIESGGSLPIHPTEISPRIAPHTAPELTARLAYPLPRHPRRSLRHSRPLALPPLWRALQHRVAAPDSTPLLPGAGGSDLAYHTDLNLFGGLARLRTGGAPMARASLAPIGVAAVPSTRPAQSSSLRGDVAEPIVRNSLSSNGLLDDARVSRLILEQLERAAMRPTAGMTGYDPRISPSYPGAPSDV